MSAVLKSLGQNSRGKRGGKTFHTPMWNLLPGFFYVLRRLNSTFQQRGLLEFIGGPSQSGRFKLNAERWWVIAAGYEMKVFSWHLTKCHMSAPLLGDMKYVNISPSLLHLVSWQRSQGGQRVILPLVYRIQRSSGMLITFKTFLLNENVHKFNGFPEIVTLRQPLEGLRWCAGPFRLTA